MPATRRAIVAVTNDLATDNRVDRTCGVLEDLGHAVELVGRVLPQSPPVERSYATRRFRLWFRKGALFYAAYNVRLFLHLLVHRVQLIVANDLDTLPACFLAARLKGAKLVYDTHEFYTEVPELVRRPFVRRIWLGFERWIFPRLRSAITVNDSIARAYEARYPRLRTPDGKVAVVRNIPVPRDLGPMPTRAELGLPEEAFILVLQGSGINVDRGGEEAVLAMRELPGCLLLLIGGGDAWPVLEELARTHGLQDRVRLIGRLPYVDMMRHTRCADLGLTLDKDSNLNYRYSLPNKLFDYLHAGIPVLATDLPEVAAIVRRFDAGVVLPDPAPERIVTAVQALRAEPDRHGALRRNAIFAAASLDGADERAALKALLEGLG